MEGGRHASPSPPGICAEDVVWLEESIDLFEKSTGTLKSFVVPGGCRQAGLLHIARTVCRRAERKLVALNQNEAVDRLVLKFVNRCSDFLFAAARFANTTCGVQDLL